MTAAADRLPRVLAAIVDLARVDAPQALDLALVEARGLVADAGADRDVAGLAAMQAALEHAVQGLEREQQQVARELGLLRRESLHRQGYRSLLPPAAAVDRVG